MVWVATSHLVFVSLGSPPRGSSQGAGTELGFRNHVIWSGMGFGTQFQGGTLPGPSGPEPVLSLGGLTSESSSSKGCSG